MSEPRGQCAQYTRERHGCSIEQITHAEMKQHCADKAFQDGPYIDQFGRGHAAPRVGLGQIFGQLKTGEVVYCEQE